MVVKWPENFDFEATRALNAPSAEPRLAGEKADAEVVRGDKDSESEKRPSRAGDADVQSVRNEEPFVQADGDLDPVALQKAFRFAAWSSIILVSFVSRLHVFRLPDMGARCSWSSC